MSKKKYGEKELLLLPCSFREGVARLSGVLPP